MKLLIKLWFLFIMYIQCVDSSRAILHEYVCISSVLKIT